MGLVDPPGRIVDGAILYQGRDITRLSEREMRALRGNRSITIEERVLAEKASIAGSKVVTVRAATGLAGT